MGTSPILITGSINKNPQPEPPKLDLNGLFQDPEFNKLSASQQRQALARVDPDFNRIDDNGYFELRKRAGHPLANSPSSPVVSRTQEPTTIDKVISFLNPLVTGAAAAGGAAMGTPFGGPVGATVGALSLGSAANMLMNKMKSSQAQPDTSVLGDAMGVTPGQMGGIPNAIGNVVDNEIGGRLIGGAISKGISGARAAFKEGYNPGAVVGDIYKLNPTFSQYYTQNFGDRSISRFLEDILATGSKGKALARSQQLAKSQGNDLAGNISGKTNSSVANPQYMADRVKIAAEIANDASYKESDLQAQTAKDVAKNNVKAVLAVNNQLPNQLTINNLPQIAGGASGNANLVRKVEGPIELDDTLQYLHDFLNDRQKHYSNIAGNQPDQALLNAAQLIFHRSDANFDAATGKLISSNPVSFEDAWETKKIMDKLYGGDTDHLSQQYRGVAAKLNDDIEKSIPLWKNDPQKALTAWQNAKATVAQRHAILGDDGVRQLINTTNSPISTIDDIIKDPKKLQRALDAGDMKFPSGNLSSTNMKKDLKGYQVMKLMNDNWKVDPINPKQGSFNVQGIANQLNDPEMAASYNKLFSPQEKANIQDFFSNVSKVSSPLIGGKVTKFAGNPKVWMMPGAIGISAGILSGHITPYAVAGVSITGAKLGGAVVGRLLTNPKTARIMVAAAKGEPLGVSDQYASNVIARVIQGSAISLIGQDGKTIDGTVNDKGQFVPLAPTAATQ